MQNISARKLSILGLVLMAASAVTAAVVPGKSDKKDSKKFANGSLTRQSALNNNIGGSSATCALDSDAITAPCNASSQDGNSATTGVGQDTSNASVSSTEGVNETINNGENNTTSTENS